MTVEPQNIILDHASDCDEAAFAPGHMLGGQYKILDLLGSGGMGHVFKVHHVFWNKEFALKVLDVERIFDELQMRRFQLEARATDSLDHPNLVKVHDFGVLDSNQPYLVMEYVEGETIADRIKRTGPLSVEEAAAIFAQVCFGLLHAHENSIIHRDIKPSNIMLVSGQPLGSEGSVRILDFGIAKLASRDGSDAMQLTRTGEVIGSPTYMSPEQCAGTAVDHRSDIYSLGCVIFEALTGKPPHSGPNALRTMMMHQMETAQTLKEASGGKPFPREMENIVSKMLQKSPSDRYENVGLIAHDLSFAVRQKNGDKQLAFATATVKNEKKKPPKLVTLSMQTFASAIAGVALATTMTTSAALCLIHNAAVVKNSSANSIRTAIAKAKQDLPEYNGERPPNFVEIVENQEISPEKMDGYRRQLDKSGPVHRILTRRANSPYPEYMYTFPSNTTFGYVYNAVLTRQNEIKLLNDHIAQGPVYTEVIPNSVQILALDARRFPTPLLVPNTLDKIDPSLFWGLEIEDIYTSGSETHAQMLAHKLQAASHWTKLECLHLYETPLSDSVLTQLMTLHHLKRLTIGHPTINKLSVVSRDFWHQLQEVVLVKVARGDIASKLSGSPNLERLLIEDGELTTKELDELASCKRLSDLQLTNDGEIDDETLQSLCNIHSLKKVYLQRIKLTPNQVKMLLECKNLQHIVLSSASKLTYRSNSFIDRRVEFKKDTEFL
ncbi:MAG TPA: serine/threonine-protein kinase [Drouetiella sp.]